jgi:hypothetical protein
MRISKQTQYYIDTIAKHEGISPSKACEALIHMGYDSWLAWRSTKTHSSPELAADLHRIHERKRDLAMLQAKVPEPESTR